MSFGKMNTFVDIVTTEPVKDSEGFSTRSDTVLASVRAYKEDRHGNEKWANRAAFSKASALFRFRRIPGLEITTSLVLVCPDGRYNIISVEDVKGRGMYIEVLAEKEVQASGKG
ncbi:MAG: head-tail adaptor protein [Firmicutes bacterium]|jgi:head-tail adaptor|nr:head-tail adaptor protein [Bacillota bacterium]